MTVDLDDLLQRFESPIEESVTVWSERSGRTIPLVPIPFL